MPTLVVDDMPVEVYERLQRRAEVRKHSIGEEAIALLEQLLKQDDRPISPRLPDVIPENEIAAPVELPRPGPAVETPYVQGKPRLPNPVM